MPLLVQRISYSAQHTHSLPTRKRATKVRLSPKPNHNSRPGAPEQVLDVSILHGAQSPLSNGLKQPLRRRAKLGVHAGQVRQLSGAVALNIGHHLWGSRGSGGSGSVHHELELRRAGERAWGMHERRMYKFIMYIYYSK